MKKYLLALPLVLCSAETLPATAQTAPAAMFVRQQNAVPESARVSVSFDAPLYFLGENVLAQFCVENVGDKPFSVDTGGDYRGAVRALRFKVSARDAAGNEVADPYPNSQCFGGIEGGAEVKPGGKFFASVPLIHYLRLDAPGEYTIRIWHDLGWKETPERPTPAAEVKITFVMPTPEQARDVVDKMAAIKPSDGGTWGQKTPAYRDYCGMRYAVYLPLLKESAANGDAATLEGIRNIATPDATLALVELAQSQHPAIAREAARLLNLRKGEEWRAEFNEPVLANARKLLASPERERLRIAADTMAKLGTYADLPLVLAALEKRIALTVRTPRWQDYEENRNDGWQLQDDCLMLIAAGAAIVSRGAALPSDYSSAAQATVFLRGLDRKPPLRPTGWEAKRLALLRHRVPFVRQLAIESFAAPLRTKAQPLSPELLAQMPKLLHDTDASVREASCDLVWLTKEKRLKAPVLDVLRISKNEWVLNSASNAAQSIGADYDAWVIFADRLDEKPITYTALEQLKQVIKGVSGGGYSKNEDPDPGARIKPKWQRFLRDHATRLKAGKRFDIGEAALKRDLFPRGFTVTVGTKEWPPAKP